MSDDLTTVATVLPITRWGAPVMHERTRPVTAFDDELRGLVRDMFATMHAAQGVGLAATQVGRDLSVFVFECPDADDVVHSGVVCNPVVTVPDARERNLDATEEGWRIIDLIQHAYDTCAPLQEYPAGSAGPQAI